MPVGVIANGSRGKPEHIADPKILLKRLINFLPPEAGISHLDLRIQVTLLSSQHCAPPINLNAAPFQHKVLSIELGVEEPFSKDFGSSFRNSAVFLPVVVLGPCIEVEMHDGCLWPGLSLCACPYKNRATIPRPTAIGRMLNELYALQIDASTTQIMLCPLGFRLVIYEDPDNLTRGNPAHNLTVYPPDCVEFARPIRRIMWPSQPGCLVWFPFGRHGKTQGAGCHIQSNFVFSHKMAGKI